jgi:5-methylthioribose kinase
VQTCGPPLLSWQLFEIDVSNAGTYLASQRGFDPASLRVSFLGGGVSNTVLLVETRAESFVVKQALGKLRVEQDWFSDRARIFRESAAMKALAPHLPPGTVPEILFEDRNNYLFAMSAAPPSARSWKSLLMDGIADDETATKIARMLAVMIRVSWQNPEFEKVFGDQTVFDQLRLDPYYRSTALRHPDLKPHFDRLVEDYTKLRVSLVHGDWSPKNFLVDGHAVTAIDFEVIHYGDPVFDAAFLLNHLLLKSFHRPKWTSDYARLAGQFWTTLAGKLPGDVPSFEARTLQHLGGLLLARIDGKSPAEYIRHETVRRQVRDFARRLILDPPPTVHEAFRRLGQ